MWTTLIRLFVDVQIWRTCLWWCCGPEALPSSQRATSSPCTSLRAMQRVSESSGSDPLKWWTTACVSKDMWRPPGADDVMCTLLGWLVMALCGFLLLLSFLILSFFQIKHLFERLRLCSYSSRHTLVQSACEGLSTGPEQWGPVPGSALPRRCWRDELLCGGPQVSWQRLRWAHQHQPQSVGAHLCSKIRNVFTVCISSPTMCSLCRLIFFTLCFMQNSLWWNCKT